MSPAEFTGTGAANDPWLLWTPSLRSQFQMHRDEEHEPPILVCAVGKTVLHYDLRIVDDMHTMLIEHGDWMELGNTDEQKPAERGIGRSLGTFGGQPDRRLVRPEEGTPGKSRQLRLSCS